MCWVGAGALARGQRGCSVDVMLAGPVVAVGFCPALASRPGGCTAKHVGTGQRDVGPGGRRVLGGAGWEKHLGPGLQPSSSSSAAVTRQSRKRAGLLPALSPLTRVKRASFVARQSRSPPPPRRLPRRGTSCSQRCGDGADAAPGTSDPSGSGECPGVAVLPAPVSPLGSACPRAQTGQRPTLTALVPGSSVMVVPACPRCSAWPGGGRGILLL